MPKSSKRKLAYNTAYESTPEQIHKRVLRNRARREYEKKHGDLPRNVEIDHKKMMDSGGGNERGNLRAVSASKNRGWRGRSPGAYSKKK